MRAPRLLILAGVFAAGCAGMVRGSDAPAPRPGEPVLAWRRATESGEAATVYARNDTTLALVATFRLSDCVNVDHPCGDLPPRTLEPGVVVEVVTVRPVDVQRDFSFNYSFTARPQ